MLARNSSAMAEARRTAQAPAPAGRGHLQVVTVHRGGDRSIATPLNISVHGRHVDVTPEIESHVKARLSGVLDKFKGAEILESDGGVAFVDVRLMNSQAEVKLQPRIVNKAVQETYVRQGQLKVCESGNGWEDSLDKALESLDRKLTKYSKPLPKKVDYRRM